MNWDWDSHECRNQNQNIYLATKPPDSTSAIGKQRTAQTCRNNFFSVKILTPWKEDCGTMDQEQGGRFHFNTIASTATEYSSTLYPNSHGRCTGSDPLTVCHRQRVPWGERPFLMLIRSNNQHQCGVPCGCPGDLLLSPTALQSAQALPGCSLSSTSIWLGFINSEPWC